MEKLYKELKAALKGIAYVGYFSKDHTIALTYNDKAFSGIVIQDGRRNADIMMVVRHIVDNHKPDVIELDNRNDMILMER